MLVLGYVVLAVLGAGYVLVSMLLGHLDGVDHSGHGDATAGDGAAAAFHFPFFSPLALATLAAAIGGLGLVARFGLRLSDGPSLLLAVPGALVVTYVVTWAA